MGRLVGPTLGALIMTFCPLVAALILVHRESGVAGQATLLQRAFDFKRIGAKRWYVPIMLLMFVAFFVGALGEELGWSGYITDTLQQRWSALQTGLVLGLVGVLWHLVALLLSHRSPNWIAWWCLYAVAARIFIAWLHNNTGQSVFGVALFHTTMNLSWMLFPVDGSHFDMRLGGLLMALTAAIVIAVWGPSRLTRHQEG